MFSGSIVALVTPMTHDGKNIDVKRLRKLVEFHIEQGTNAIVAAGTTGEAATLTFEEKKQVIKTVVAQVHQRIPVIAGTAANSTQQTIELTLMAMEQGVDAVLIMTPAYIKPTQEGLYWHYKKIAEAVAIPQILYNIPSRTACDLLPETIEKLAAIANIIGIKEGTGNLNRFMEIHNHCGDTLDVYSGDDFTAKDFILLGSKGVISVTANVAPKMMAQMCDYGLTKQENLAHELHQKLLPLHQALFVETSPIPVKWAVARMGLIEDNIRLPLTKFSAAYHAQVVQAMNQLGLI